MEKVYQDAPVNELTRGHEYVNEYFKIRFQNGAVKEVGDVNGTCNETIIQVLLDRMNYLNEIHEGGKFKCRENSIAITKLEEALLWLNYRTRKRLERGVEGLNKA